MPLSPDKMLATELSAIMGRNQFTKDPAPVIDELRAAAGRRRDILAHEVGLWIGFYDAPDTRTLADALRAAFADLDLAPGIKLGEERRQRPSHGTHDFHPR
jgi:hypothetical protein